MKKIYISLIANRHHVAFFILLLFSVRLLFNNEQSNLDLIRAKTIDTFSFILAPFDYYRSLVRLHDENDLLRDKNIQFRLELEEFRNMRQDYEHLRELLGFREQSRLSLLPANVLLMGMTPNATSMIIDVGAADSVEKNLPVISSDGIVGKTILCGQKSSTVQIYSDMSFRISIRILPSGTTGILRWVHTNEAEVQEVRKNAPISIGDRVITSGYSNIYPKNIPVGKVVGVENIRGRDEKIVRVQLASDLTRISDVFVILKHRNE